jgi:hypothetical protein
MSLSSIAPRDVAKKRETQSTGVGTNLKVMIDRGPTELVQYSAYWGSSYQRKGGTSHIVDMVWLYHSLYPCLHDFYLPTRRRVEGGS